ncbi:MAG TPA: tRNA uridine-5-carboxymethylaminomethyl(34) synthesis enzyme MnmG [bacterium]|jgi:tRNA uridine 5-carboxymethylaminomethyl modification enzyme|nr:tRNA uridine-5-carboxymethylaminomethyl(34) synthesis enzyme MnmG [bacterium]MDX9804586.1 tRNA uridine-5-carboxymethylaminomethyl(34) synthesis enzyme MnmG [bacterium]HNW15076.1 tRNA uridine-5-carboxymethylaminomethyl(34) synthesis enzyme MnmG [bacterium]HNZ52763.1 tRNA uridine-5-carboxymethylaminomethyl(34) synthesis enzyme MnmG [bacterium]HOB70565.1 tRNA uridine-5-carboxymethylaminomethyl(34) synthesis enzyme MnmG [bacterium]
MDYFDVAVIGGGHAGIEASYASSKTGASTLLITTSIEKIGEMSCNPSIGGQAKGQIVREIDIFGGLMGRAADYSAIQYRILNRRKGTAVQALRAQCDKNLYKEFVRNFLFQTPNLKIFQGEAFSLEHGENSLFKITTSGGSFFQSKAVIVTAGTFLNGTVHIGLNNFSSGRLGEPASSGLSEYISGFGHKKVRLKTGTPVRILGNSIDFSKMETQEGETDIIPFSIFSGSVSKRQIPCYLTRTTDLTKKIILENLHFSPMYGTSKSIEGIGPRYCPSIEDKFVKFPLKESHQIFVEPEGWDCFEYYPNGISTSLPFNVQKEFLKTIPGLENAVITRPAYAIEYDSFDPTDIDLTLMSRFVPGLFLAGQVNGTSGYEEAAGQGLVAGVNAAYFSKKNGKIFVPGRSKSYIGVMISDITSKGVDEPYRMFTSRAEYRLSIRDNNVAERLLELSFSNGLISEKVFLEEKRKCSLVSELVTMLNEKIIYPDKETNARMEKLSETPLNKPVSLSTVLKRPSVGRKELFLISGYVSDAGNEIWSRAETEIKYSSFVEREKAEIQKFEELSSISIPDGFDFNSISGFTNEIKQKLSARRPKDLAQASMIPGITPAAISILIMHLKRDKA